jgi:hypothetical protein
MNFDLLNHLNNWSTCVCTRSRICEICDYRFIFFMLFTMTISRIIWTFIWWFINLNGWCMSFWLTIYVWLNYYSSWFWCNWNSVGRLASDWSVCFLFSVNRFSWYWWMVWFVIFIFWCLMWIYWFFWLNWRIEWWIFSIVNQRRKWGMRLNRCESKWCSMMSYCLMRIWFWISFNLWRRWRKNLLC